MFNIAEYYGMRLSPSVAELNKNIPAGPHRRNEKYLSVQDGNVLIDATDSECAGRFGNHSLNPNARFVPVHIHDTNIDVVGIESIRPRPSRGEPFVGYGWDISASDR